VEREVARESGHAAHVGDVAIRDADGTAVHKAHWNNSARAVDVDYAIARVVVAIVVKIKIEGVLRWLLLTHIHAYVEVRYHAH
jgi:hypothetical protein